MAAGSILAELERANFLERSKRGTGTWGARRLDGEGRARCAPRVRLAGAPISWGVCEVPGWGLQLPPERVLGEMAGLGLTATELGPLGWLPRDPGALRERLDAHGLALVGGFVPLVLHEPALGDARAAAEDAARGLAAAGAEVFVCALVADAGWSAPPALDDARPGRRRPQPRRRSRSSSPPTGSRSPCTRTPAR